jgi:hypothetical protein
MTPLSTYPFGPDRNTFESVYGALLAQARRYLKRKRDAGSLNPTVRVRKAWMALARARRLTPNDTHYVNGNRDAGGPPSGCPYAVVTNETLTSRNVFQILIESPQKGGTGMTTGIASQLAALQRIAAFSAKVRGHDLGAWDTREGCSVARCIRCGAALNVYFPVLQPELEGAAVESLCDPRTVAGKAA